MVKIVRSKKTGKRYIKTKGKRYRFKSKIPDDKINDKVILALLKVIQEVTRKKRRSVKGTPKLKPSTASLTQQAKVEGSAIGTLDNAEQARRLGVQVSHNTIENSQKANEKLKDDISKLNEDIAKLKVTDIRDQLSKHGFSQKYIDKLKRKDLEALLLKKKRKELQSKHRKANPRSSGDVTETSDFESVASDSGDYNSLTGIHKMFKSPPSSKSSKSSKSSSSSAHGAEPSSSDVEPDSQHEEEQKKKDYLRLVQQFYKLDKRIRKEKGNVTPELYGKMKNVVRLIDEIPTKKQKQYNEGGEVFYNALKDDVEEYRKQIKRIEKGKAKKSSSSSSQRVTSKSSTDSDLYVKPEDMVFFEGDSGSEKNIKITRKDQKEIQAIFDQIKEDSGKNKKTTKEYEEELDELLKDWKGGDVDVIIEGSQSGSDHGSDLSAPVNSTFDVLVDKLGEEEDPEKFKELLEKFENRPHDEGKVGVLKVLDPKDKKGSGIGDNSGLWSDEINKVMSEYKKRGFKGTFAIDEIGHIPFSPSEKEISFIINTRKRDDDLSGHWQAVFLTKQNLEFYDSFADDPSPEFMRYIKPLLKRWSSDPLQFKINSVKKQNANSNSCGYFAMLFLKDRYAGKNFKQATGFQIIDDSMKGEKRVKQFKKLLKPFKYI